MKILHTGDLHLGKKLNEVDLKDDQLNVLKQIILAYRNEQFDVLIIAGDVYEISNPSAETVELYNAFLEGIQTFLPKVKTIIVSGNHDSEERMNLGSTLFKKANFYITAYPTEKPVLQMDGVNFYAMPYITHISVANAFKNDEPDVHNTIDAIKYVIDRMNINKEEINILVSHQMVIPTHHELDYSESELNIGNIEAVPASLYQDFDYVALGHIHKPQDVTDKIRYAGSILKYHHGESFQEKSFTLIEINGKNDIKKKIVPIKPVHDVIVIKGMLDNLIKNVDPSQKDCYVYAKLMDLVPIENAIGKLRAVYPNCIGLVYENKREKMNQDVSIEEHKNMSLTEVFKEFFFKQNGREMTEDEDLIVFNNFEEREDD